MSHHERSTLHREHAGTARTWGLRLCPRSRRGLRRHELLCAWRGAVEREARRAPRYGGPALPRPFAIAMTIITIVILVVVPEMAPSPPALASVRRRGRARPRPHARSRR